MGVELRSIQRKFHSLMGEVKPAIRPRFVVWLDERLAEFKIKGQMDLSETLDDPQWIREYYMCKREAKAAAIMKREARDTASSGSGPVYPKVEAKSESSNGVLHPDQVVGGEHKQENNPELPQVSGHVSEEVATPAESDFQLVEIKEELLEQEEDDDMIIIGETIAPPAIQTSSTQYNLSRQMHPGYSRSLGPFQRKRQRFGALPQKTGSFLSGNRHKSRMKYTSRSSAFQQGDTAFDLHTPTSDSVFSSVSSTHYSEQPVFSNDPARGYDSGGTETYQDMTTFSANESLRIPSHFRAEARQLNISEGDYGGDTEMYMQYGDETYDSSFVTDSTETSLQYDEEGNAVITGERNPDDTSEPIAGTSKGRPLQDAENLFEHYPYVRLATNYLGNDTVSTHPFICSYCFKRFSSRGTLKFHINYYHLLRRRVICDTCGKTFPSVMNLEGHVNSVHLNIRPFVCEKCQASFFYRADLQRHKKTCKAKLN